MTKSDESKLRDGDTVMFRAGAAASLTSLIPATYHGIKRGKVHVKWTINGETKQRLVVYGRVRLLDSKGRLQP